MLNIIIGRFLNHSFSALADTLQTLQESNSTHFSQIKEFLSQKVGDFSEIVSILDSKELISNETGKIFLQNVKFKKKIILKMIITF